MKTTTKSSLTCIRSTFPAVISRVRELALASLRGVLVYAAQGLAVQIHILRISHREIQCSHSLSTAQNLGRGVPGVTLLAQLDFKHPAWTEVKLHFTLDCTGEMTNFTYLSLPLKFHIFSFQPGRYFSTYYDLTISVAN